jgi:endoglucanase
MARAIWAHELAVVNDEIYLGAGDWAPALGVLAVNPSYFAPYAYHVFQEVDPEHDWLRVIDSGYRLLFSSSAAELGSFRSAGLPADWLGIDRPSGQIVPLSDGPADTTAYGFDAPRTYWRIGLDLRWNQDGRAAAYLGQAGFLRDEVRRAGFVRAIYNHDGSVGSSESSVVGVAGALAALMTLDSEAAHQLYAGQLLGGVDYVNREAHWGDPGDLYAQEWGWFATGLYAEALVDVWHGERQKVLED